MIFRRLVYRLYIHTYVHIIGRATLPSRAIIITRRARRVRAKTATVQPVRPPSSVGVCTQLHKNQRKHPVARRPIKQSNYVAR